MAKKRKKRRAEKGTGSIFPHRGKYRVAIRINGKQITRTARSQAEAEMIRDGLIQDQQAKKILGSSILDIVDRYVADHTGGAKPSTQTSIKYSRKHIESIGDRDAGYITGKDVSDWLSKLRAEGVGTESQRKAFSLLRRSTRYALSLGVIESDPCKSVPARKTVKNRVEAFTEEDVKEILKEVKGDTYEAIYWLAFTMGMRQGEIFGLQWKHIDFKAETVTIERQALESDSAAYIENTPKSANSYRTLNLSEGALSALSERRKAALIQKKARKSDLVFTNRNGKMLRRSNFAYRHWKPLLRELGFEDCGLHKARHTAASILLSKGLEVSSIAAFLGDTVETVIRTYLHWIKHDHKEAASIMTNIMETPTKASDEQKDISNTGG